MKKILFLLIFSFPFSQWSNSPDNPLTLGSGIQPQIASCTDGSVYIAWLTESTFHVFLQKIDPEGNIIFPDGGLLVSDHPNSSWIAVFHLNLVTDLEGNAILSFVDERTGSWNVFAYKISPDGDFLWGDDGIQLSFNTTGNISPRLTALPDNSVAISWSENYSVVRMQRILSDGSLAWDGGGLSIFDPNASLMNPFPIVSDDGNILLRWIRQTGPIWAATSEILMQTYDSDGNPIWPAPAPVSGQMTIPMGNWSQKLVSDLENGSYSAWTSMTTNNQTCFAQSVDSFGSLQWPSNVELSTFSNHFRTNPVITVAEASHEVIASWTQSDGAQSQHGIYAQRLSVNGDRLWGNSGIPAVPLNSQYSYLDVSIVSFDEDAVTVFNQQSNTMQGDLFAYKLDSTGNFVWTPSMFQMTSSEVSKSDVLMTKGPGCVFVCWSESGNIMAHCLRGDGTLGPPQPGDESFSNGDVNFDGSTNILDIVSIVNFIVGLQIPTLEQECTADLNQDGEINVLDIVIIVNLIVGN